MFFILSKTVAFLLLPSNLLIILGLAGVVLLATRWRRAGARITVASIVLLASAGFLPIGNILIHALESRFPSWDPARGAPDGIVVLGNAISPRLSSAFGEPVLGGGSRILAMSKLARAYPNARIVYSGGDPSLLGGGVRETDFVYPLLDSLGVARERALLETRSRNNVRTAYAARGRLLPAGRLPRRAISSRLAHDARFRLDMGANAGGRLGST